jgi:hypothetical protein
MKRNAYLRDRWKWERIIASKAPGYVPGFDRLRKRAARRGHRLEWDRWESGGLSLYYGGARVLTTRDQAKISLYLAGRPVLKREQAKFELSVLPLNRSLAFVIPEMRATI